MDKEDFLRLTREALGKTQRRTREEDIPLFQEVESLGAKASATMARLEEQRTDLVERLAEVADARGWRVARASDTQQAMDHIMYIVQRSDASLVVRSGQDVFRQLPVDETLSEQNVMLIVMQGGGRGHRGLMRQAAAEAELGITGVDYAVAETGSAVLLPRRHVSRLTSLLPPVHLAIVRPQEIVDRLEDLLLLRRLAFYQGSGEMGSYLNFITGPSRTADIEQQLVIGVHGPKEAHMLIWDDAGAAGVYAGPAPL